MRHALRLARKAKGRTSPNPLVGAVVVQDGHIVGQGYHRRAGGSHAEIIALQMAGPQARGATLYVTLEPCCHKAKRTPPCVPAVKYSGVRRVVIAMRDPNPKVKSKGVQQLREAGIEVDVGCLEQEAQELNQFYRHWIMTGRPFVILKAAMTLDGKIATATGESKWITGEKARLHVHHLRSQVDAIMVGIGTVIKDNPELSVRKNLSSKRAEHVRQPIRVVLDSGLRISPKAKILHWALEQPTIICTTTKASKAKKEQLKKNHVHVLEVSQQQGKVSLRSCFRKLGKLGITSVVVEGGSELNAAILQRGLVNHVQLYVASILLGGNDAKGVIGGRSPKYLKHALPINNLKVKRLGEDFLWTGDCVPKSR